MTMEHTPTPFEQAYEDVYFPCHICLVEAARHCVYERSEVRLIGGKITCANCAQDTYPGELGVEIPSPSHTQAEIARLREALEHLIVQARLQYEAVLNGGALSPFDVPSAISKARAALSEAQS